MDLRVTRYEVDDDGVALVTLARPGRGNSWTARMNAEYRWILARLEADPNARVIVLTGDGKQFCVGADFKALDHYTDPRNDYTEGAADDRLARPGHGVRPEFDHDLVWQWGVAKPIIAAINGACAGIGVSLACFCDLRYAVAGTKFTTASARLGLPLEYGLGWVLPRLVGVTHAADILLTGRIFTSEEALDMGLLNAVFPADDFERRVKDVARSMATTVSPLAAAVSKRQLYAELLAGDVGETVETSKRLIGRMMRLPDFKEGVAALQAKRRPTFPGLTPDQLKSVL